MSEDRPRGRVVDAEGPVYVTDWPGRGSARTTFVCVHGTGASSRAWDVVAPRLARHGRVLAPDLPGFGRSPAAGRRLTTTGAQQALDGVLRALAGAPVVLVGASLGGAVAARQAWTRPDSVRALVLSSGYLPAYYGGPRAPGVVAGMLLEQVGKLGQALRTGQLARSALGSPLPGDEKGPSAGASTEPEQDAAARRLSPTSARTRLAAAVGYNAGLAASALAPARARRHYAGIRCPVLLLHGAEDRQVPVGWARAAVRRYPGWRLREFPSVAHVVKLEEPRWWLDAVDDWLADTGITPG